MTSEIGRMLKCLKNKSYHSLQDDAYSHITLLQTEETSSQPNEDISSTTTNTTVSKHNSELIPSPLQDKSNANNKPNFKTKSLDSLTEEVLNSIDSTNVVDCHLNENINSGPISPNIFSDQRSLSNNCGSSSSSSPPASEGGIIGKSTINNNSSGSGGLFSFLGLKFNKSSTRHLDRSSSGDSSGDKSEPCNPNRYTKFPLRGNSTVAHTPEAAAEPSNPIIVTPDPSSTSSRSSVESHSQSSSEISSAPQSNSKFDISQIQLTPQTKVYSNPNRSPPQSSSRKGAFSASNFISKSISSFGKKSGNSNHKNSSSFINKRKSKSDNNLHRVDLGRNSAFSISGGASGGESSINNSRSGVVAGGGSSGLTTNSSQNIYNSEPRSELRLNSVQIGDHQTIHLPWTGPGLQRNNLSTTTPHRVHQHTHHNNFFAPEVRYVECGFKLSRTAGDENSPSSNNFALIRPEETHARLHNHYPATSIQYTSCTAVKRRSRSLERDAGHRINPRNSIACSSAGTLNSSHTSSKSFRGRGLLSNKGAKTLGGGVAGETTANSANSNFGLHQVRRCLTPEEQEILLRNISWDSFTLEPRAETPPPRPEKPASLRNKFACSFDPSTNPSQHSKCASSSSSSSSFLSKKPPHIGAIRRSAPNSFSVSSGSNDSINNCSAPPSPPPRPPSSLKPESRLITSIAIGAGNTHRVLPNKSCTSGGVIRSTSFKTPHVSPSQLLPISSKSDVDENNSSDFTIHRMTFEKNTEQRNTNSQHQSLQLSSTSSSTDPIIAATLSSNCQKASTTMSIDETQSSRFISKPMKGWLHSDQLLSKEGVTYTVRYIGCVDVNKSMKSLDFDTRSLIAKECINQVCEAAGVKSVDRKRKFDRNVMRILGTRPRLEHAGLDVHLTITSTCLKLTSLDTGAVIAAHEMPQISFASGGDTTMLDFIAYVAKDNVVGRACFILKCGSGLAQDVIITIGQAFELRFKEYIQKRPPPPRLPLADDREYYNDLPGKLPPDVEGKCNGNNEGKGLGGKGKEIPTLTLPISSEVSVNLIDFEAPTPPAWDRSTLEFEAFGSIEPPTFSDISAVAGSSTSSTGLGLPNSPSQPNKPVVVPNNKDSFDMQPFTTALSGPEQRKNLETQSWFHGCISRNQAEHFVKNDGDFLVRESQTTPGQYVLTGLQNGSPKHLLLVDPAGVVRTKDQTFDNVIHLVRHHSDNCLPIISAESMVILRQPVPRESSVP